MSSPTNPAGSAAARQPGPAHIWAIALSLLALFLITLHWYHAGKVIGEIDLFPDLRPFTLLTKTALAWSHATTPFGSFDLPTFSFYYLVQAGLAIIFGAGLAQIILFWLGMAAGWLGAFALARSLRFRMIPALCVAWVYLLNPYIQFVVPWITGSAFFAALPWVLWFLHRAALQPSFRPKILKSILVVAFIAVPWVASTPQLFFELMLIALAWWLYLVKHAKPGFKSWALKALVLGTAVSLWWLVPEFVALFSSTIGHATTGRDVAWSFANSSITNNLRFINVWTWLKPHFIPYAANYDGNLLVFASGFFGVFVLLQLLRSDRLARSPLAQFLIGLFIVSIFIAKGPHEPLRLLNYFIYRIPGFFLLIEAAGFSIAALLVTSIATGLYLQHLMYEHKKPKNVQNLRTSVFLVAIVGTSLLSASPILNGRIFPSQKVLHSIHPFITLPKYWDNAAAFINQSAASGSLLVLPPDRSYQATYSWGYEGVDLIPAMLFNRPSLMLGPSLDYLVNPSLEEIKEAIGGMIATRSNELLPALESLGIRFVLCRGDVLGPVRSANMCPFTPFGSRLREKTFGKLTVYQLPKSQSRFSISTRYLVTTSSKSVTPGDLFLQGLRLGGLPQLDNHESKAGKQSRIALMDCAAACRRASFFSAVSLFSPRDGPVAYRGFTHITYAFDSPPRVRTIALTGPFESTEPASFHTSGLLTTLEVIRNSPTIQSAYIFNPTTSNVRATIKTTLELRLTDHPGCIRVSLSSPYKIGDILKTRRFCAASGHPAAAFGRFNVPPGLTQFTVSGSLGRITPSDIFFKIRQPSHQIVRVVPPGAQAFSKAHSFFVLSGAILQMPAQDIDTVAYTHPTPVPYVGRLLLVTARSGKYTFSCALTPFPPGALVYALRNCLRTNGISASQMHLKIVRFDEIAFLSANVLSPLKAIVAAGRLHVNGRVLGIHNVLKRLTWDARAMIGASLPSFVAITFKAFSHSRAVLSIATACGRKSLVHRYSSREVKQEETLVEVLPLPTAQCRSKARIQIRVVPHKGAHPGSRLTTPTISIASASRTVRLLIGHRQISQGVQIGQSMTMVKSPDDIVTLLHGSASPSILVLASQQVPPRATLPIPMRHAFGLADVLYLPNGKSRGLLVDNTAFSPTWLALRLNVGHPFLRHVRVNGWQNGWMVSGGSVTIIVFNLINFLEVACAFLGLAIILVAWRAVK